jgi:hypothetical protein
VRNSHHILKAMVFVLLGIGTTALLPAHNASAATPIQKADYQQTSFSKTVDFYDYVRQYATENGLTPPSATEHAYLYTNYVNIRGFQLFYIGLVNATHNGRYVTIPLQTFFEHYNTPQGKDVITASSYLSLVAFNESASGDLYPNSPDRTDSVYASFSLGVDMSSYTSGHAIPLVASSQVIPLTTTDNLHWTWGLKYTNLNAIWWKIDVNPLSPSWDANVPRGIAQYNELTFQYDLTIDPTAKTAKLTASYTVGRITDLWLLGQTPALHLNSTGTYYGNGTRVNTQSVYSYLQQRQMKLSIVLANKTILASQKTTDDTETGKNVDNDTSADISNTAINTKAPDGETVFKSDFGVKANYQLYDASDANPTTVQAVTRTVARMGWGGNPAFAFQNVLTGFLPLFVAHVAPELYNQAKSGLVDLSLSNYLYIISYPQWNGYKIVHDPDFTAFFQPSQGTGLLTVIFIAVAAAATIGGVVAFLLRKRRTGNLALTSSPSAQGPTPPSPSGSPGPA